MIGRLTCGTGSYRLGAHAQLASAVAQAARDAGFTVKAIRVSHSHGSQSRYVWLVDGQVRLWLVRVSNHARGDKRAAAVPHLDFVSRDGEGGLDRVRDWLARAASGMIDWHDPYDYRRSPRGKRTA